MTKEDLIASLSRKPVEHTAAGVSVYLRPLGPQEVLDVIDFEKSHDRKEFNDWLFVRSVCDDSGKRLLEDEDAGLIESLSFSPEVVFSVISRAFELNGMARRDAGNVTTEPASISSADSV